MFKFLLYKFGQFCVNRLPVGISYWIARFLSDLQYWFSPRDRKAVKNNLRLILGTKGRPEDEARITATALKVFENFGLYLVEFFRMAHKVDEQFIRENVAINNIGVIDAMLKRGKGVVILTAHIGNWELGGVVLSKLGYPIVAIALPHKERPVNDLFNQQRETHGVTIIPMSIAVRRCIEALKENKLVALLADRDFTHHGEELDFLGRRSMIPKGAAVFAIKTGAAIVPTFLTRNNDNRFTLMMGEPILPTFVDEHVKDHAALLALMRQYSAVIERKIREFPDQWLMFREFWSP